MIEKIVLLAPGFMEIRPLTACLKSLPEYTLQPIETGRYPGAANFD
jgi:hypothetical protein